MKTEVTKKEMKAENLVDDFVKQWREKNNTEDAVYSAYHYDSMIAFAEYYNKILNQNTMENGKQQTSVEWLKEQYDSCPDYERFLGESDWEKAKEMEKEQIIEAYKYGNQSDVYYKPEQYYKETFKSE